MTTFNPGDRVALDDGVRTGVVLSADDPRARNKPRHVDAAVTVPVLLDGWNETVQWWHRSRTSHFPATTDFPVGALVRDTKYDLLGTVVPPRSDGFTRAKFRTQGSTIEHTASFPDPEGRLERVYLLSREELTRIEAGLRTGIPSDENDAADIVRKHLHPKVKRTFTVTVEQASDMPPLTSASLRDAVISNSFVNNQIGVTVLDTTHKENDR